jgi:hypothetical protein
MAGVARQDMNSIFVGDQLEGGVSKVLRRPVKFRAKLSVLFAIDLDPAVQAGHLLRVPADKKFALQIGQPYPILGRKRVLSERPRQSRTMQTMPVDALRRRSKFAGPWRRHRHRAVAPRLASARAGRLLPQRRTERFLNLFSLWSSSVSDLSW